MLRMASVGVLVFVAAAVHGAQPGWQSLFNGRSLAGWRATDSGNVWRVENGVLVASGAPSHLYFVGSPQRPAFKNFELEADVMTRPGADSGIYFHTTFTPSGVPATGLEVQIKNSDFRSQHSESDHRRTGSLHGIRNIYGQLVPDNDWFRLNIAVRGPQIQVRVNGVLTVDYVEPAPPAVEGEQRLRVLSRGTFALQLRDADSTVLFRRIRVRRLPDDAPAHGAPPAVDNTYRALLQLSGDNFPVVDFHTHLKEALTLDDVLKRWHEQGIYAGVAVNGGLSFPINSDEGLEPFLHEMSGKPVFVAFQAEGREWVRLFSRRMLERFDYVFTDSMTWTDDTGRRMRLWIDREVGTIDDAEKFMATLVARTVTILSEEPIDIYVNPTFLPNQLAARYDELWTGERMDRVIAALAANGIALEINTRYRIPSAAFITRARAAGVKFTCGTNNSGARDLGRLEYCVEMIRECGLTWRDMWVPPVEGLKAVQRKPLVLTRK